MLDIVIIQISTSQEEAEENFLNMFDVSITKHVQFKNYVAKEPVE